MTPAEVEARIAELGFTGWWADAHRRHPLSLSPAALLWLKAAFAVSGREWGSVRAEALRWHAWRLEVGGDPVRRDARACLFELAGYVDGGWN